MVKIKSESECLESFGYKIMLKMRVRGEELERFMVKSRSEGKNLVEVT